MNVLLLVLGSAALLVAAYFTSGRWLARAMPAHQLERLAGLLMVALGLWLGRQAAVHLTPLPSHLPLS